MRIEGGIFATRCRWGAIPIPLPTNETQDRAILSNVTYFLTVPSWSLAVYNLFSSTLIVATLLLVSLWWKRSKTYHALVRCGLPTVYWRPKFVNYELDNTKQLPSSTITNMLPRMERLKGPYGMYGTVYGVSTAVVHVAHPVPALALLGASVQHSEKQQAVSRNPSAKKRPSWLSGPSQSTPTTVSVAGVSKIPAYNHFKNFCGEGVFTAEGNDWRSKRAAVLHALLRGSGGTSFHERMEQEAHRAAQTLIQELDRELKSKNSYKTNIVPVLQRATIRLIYRYITHTGLSSVEEDGSFADGDADNPTKVPQQHTSLIAAYLNSITRIRMIILAQSRSIWFLLPRWCYTYFAALYKEEECTMRSIRQVAVKACQQAQADSPLGLLQKNPLYAENGREVSFSKNLIDEAITLLFAGQDTSAATLSWTLHLLTLYPHFQAKLAEEVCGVLGRATPDYDNILVTKKLIAKMPYLDAVIKESMRLYPVAPFVVRKLGCDVEIAAPNGGSGTKQPRPPALSLPDGSLACIWIYSLHRHPQFWNRPDDFLPERWLETCAEQRDLGITTPGAYIPFAAGPRNCVGHPLANVILRSLLARLAQRYEFRDDRVAKLLEQESGDRYPPKVIADKVAQLRIDMQAGFTVLPQGGLRLSIQHRNCESSLIYDKQVDP